MWLSVNTNSPFAAHLTYLLHKHPGTLHTKEWSRVKAWLYFHSRTPDELGWTLLLHPLSNNTSNISPSLSPSYWSVGLNKFFSSAMNGISEDAHDLVDHSFAWQVQFENPSDPDFLPLLSGWLKNIPGVDSSNANEGVFEIKIKCPLKILLRILYVFFIAADSNSHLATTLESRALLLEKGKEWLDFHPDKTNIANYFLRSKNRDEEQAVVIENIFKIQNTAEWLIQENQSIHRYHFHQNKNNSNSTPEVLPYKKIFQQKNQVNLFLWNNDIESYTHLLFIVKEEGTSKLLNILSRYEWWIKKDWKHIYVLHKKGNIHWQLPALKKWTTSMVFEDDHYKAYLLKYQKDVA